MRKKNLEKNNSNIWKRENRKLDTRLTEARGPFFCATFEMIISDEPKIGLAFLDFPIFRAFFENDSCREIIYWLNYAGNGPRKKERHWKNRLFEAKKGIFGTFSIKK